MLGKLDISFFLFVRTKDNYFVNQRVMHPPADVLVGDGIPTRSFNNTTPLGASLFPLCMSGSCFTWYDKDSYRRSLKHTACECGPLSVENVKSVFPLAQSTPALQVSVHRFIFLNKAVRPIPLFRGGVITAHSGWLCRGARWQANNKGDFTLAVTCHPVLNDKGKHKKEEN